MTAVTVAGRRNNPGWWADPIRWTRLTAQTRPSCGDCLINTHVTHGEGRPAKARWRRKAGTQVEFSTDLCDPHRAEWLDWTPGQMVMPS